MAEEENVSRESEEGSTESVEQVISEFQEEKKEAEKPEFIPTKFWDAEKNELKVKEFADSYKNLEKAFHTKVDDLTPVVKKQIESDMIKDRPETANGYEVKLDEPFGDIQLPSDDPLVSWWKDTCYKSGYNNEIFNEGINQYLKASTSNVPDHDTEMGKLGENSSARLESVDLWLKKQLSGDEYDTMADYLTTADSVRAVEKIMKQTQSNVSTQQTPSSPLDASESRKELEKMMKDPRYFHPQHRDETFIKKVEESFKKIFPEG
tara:strand:+ start:1400 stop:2191 length:792 start_codon:yes stop_codon:yes gene_type:complete